MYKKLIEAGEQDENVKLMLKRESMFSELNSSFQQSKREHFDMPDVKTRMSKHFKEHELDMNRSVKFNELNQELDMISDQRKMKHIQKQSKLKRLRGECYIGFHKLISSQMRNIDMKHSKIFGDNIKKLKSNTQSGDITDPKLSKNTSNPKKRKDNQGNSGNKKSGDGS